MDIRFDGRVAVVTGAGSGLGRSHALFFASRGAKVAVNDLGGGVDGSGQSSKAADLVVQEIKAAGGQAIANYDSVADAKGAQNLIDRTLQAFGQVDILVNNAGILRDKTFAKMTLADFEKVVAVHFLGSVYVTKAAWPVMQERLYGRVVMTTSAAGLYGNFGQTNYGAAKLAVVGFMNALKLEGQKFNILVNTIAPVAATRMTEGLLPPQALDRLKPDLVTPAVAYLCSEQCRDSGQVIDAGGGYYARTQLMESPGIRFDPSQPVTPEMLAAQWSRITDMSGARGFAAANEEVMQVFQGLGK